MHSTAAPTKTMTAARFAVPCMIIAVCTMRFAPIYAGMEVPGSDLGVPLVLRGGTFHPIAGPSISNGMLIIRDGRIEWVGPANDEIPEGAEVVDVTDLHVYPGLIDADTSIGLVEIAAVRATNDIREVGSSNPNVLALKAFNPDSELIPVARSDGVLLAHSVPQGNFIAGISSLMALDGWQSDEMALAPMVGLHVFWPTATVNPFAEVESQGRNREKERQERLDALEQSLRDAEAYSRAIQNGRPPQTNLRLEAMSRVVERQIPLMVHADDLLAIQEAVTFAARFNVRLIIVGGYDAPRCADLLRRHEVPVIVTGTHRLPLRRHSPVHEPFAVPARLQEAGVEYCLAGFDRFSGSAVRNLPQHAGTAAAFGLTPEQAVRSITLSAAEILGVADRVGSLEAGKDATMIVTTGDVLDIPTQVTAAYIQGRPVDLDNRHKRLWRKYQEKNRRFTARPTIDASN